MKPGRSDSCSCGSGKKFKHCCAGKSKSRAAILPSAEIAPLIALYNGCHYAELERRANLLVGQQPDFGFGWKLLAGALQMQGKDALYAFQNAAKLTPGDPEAHYNLGVALKGAGRLEDAERSYRRAVSLNPDYAEAHSNLGNTLKDMGRFKEAVSSCQRAVNSKPDSADAHNNLGTVLKELGRFDEAVASYSRAVTLKPDYALAYYNLANTLKDIGQPERAVVIYRRAIQIKPDFFDAHNNLGAVLKELEKFDEAAASYRSAIRIKPDFAKIYVNLGIVLCALEQLDEGAENYNRALQIDPECVEALIEAGQLCKKNGDLSEAEDLTRKALEINSNNLDARLSLVGVKKVQAGDENLAALVAVEAAARSGKSPLPDKLAIPLHFSLGKGFDDIRDYANAFHHYREGCKLKRATVKYDAEKTTRYFNDIMQVFDGKTIERLRGGGDPSRLPIFVLGMPRSGTTLTEQIIASHPDVYGAGELTDLEKILRRVTGEPDARFPFNIPMLDRSGLAVWAADYVAGLQLRAPQAKRITDKMPANFFAVGMIHVMLPNAKIIHVNRNPVDTCLSCFTQFFGLKLDYTYDLAELGQYYVNYARLMGHWRSVLPAGSFFDVQYEDIVADQETVAKQLIEYCELDWNDVCIDFHKHKRPINTVSVTQVRQPIYKSSVERWRNYEDFLGPLLDTLGDLVPNQAHA